jgi:hypothetical protein
MQENEDREPLTQPEGRLEPPARIPPTAVGAGTPDPDESGKEVVVRERISVRELSGLIHVSAAKLVWAAFNELGKLITVRQKLAFEDTRVIAARFGYAARLRETWRPGRSSDDER